MKGIYLSTTMTALVLSLASLTLPPAGELNAADPFTKITEEPWSDVGNSRGAAWGDYDNDGFIDLFIAQRGPGGNGSAFQFLYHNNRDGTFSRITTGTVAEVFGAGAAAAWADYDNDGNLDLVLFIRDQPNYLFHNNGNGSFTSVPFVAAFVIAPPRSVTWVDYDIDGYVDLFITAQVPSDPNWPRLLFRNNPRRDLHANHPGRFPHRPGQFLRRGVGRLQQRWPARPVPAASRRDERPAQLPLPKRRRRHVYSRGRRHGLGWHFQ
ncbi:MAG TPA: VCBS repeat-containing protein [Verrucomicrobiae bacterium]|nr:VCBS repeat-containing protein [Verrucomicrobiae bacterium]